jgi:hypothetical protein
MARKKTGIIRSDKELDKLAEVTPEDIQLAQEWWREKARPAFRKLLDTPPAQRVRSEDG